MQAMYPWIKQILFCLNPEKAHHVTLKALQWMHFLGLIKSSPVTSSPIDVMGLHFPNRVGLAAGLDKNGEYIDALAALGFGFIEIGTVTPQPQSGNPLPRLFRLQEQEAIINRMGFNNKGINYVVERLKKTKYKGILGINIGKNRTTSQENAVQDYVQGFRAFAPYASYITINISSPNTPGLRDLQQKHMLQALLHALKLEQAEFFAQEKKYVPLVVKISPDLSEEELTAMATTLLLEKIDGVIATNTTIQREEVNGAVNAAETGGLSGKPLSHQTTKIIVMLNQRLQNRIPIIGCGGIFSAKHAQEKYAAGAMLLQVYTGLIYRGPAIIAEIAKIAV